MKRVMICIVIILISVLFLVSCFQQDVGSNVFSSPTPTGTIGEIIVPPTGTNVPSPTPIMMVNNSFGDFFVNTDELWYAENNLNLQANPYEDCPERLNLEPFNIQTHMDDPSLKTNEIRVKYDYIDRYKYVGVVRDSGDIDAVYWIDIRNLKLEDKRCGKIGSCDVDLFIGIGDPNRDYDPDDFTEDALVTYKSGYGLFLVFRNFHDYETRQEINRVCLLRALGEPCSHPLGEDNSQFKNNLLDYQWRIKITKHGQKFIYELFYCSKSNCDKSGDYKSVPLNMESREIVLDDSEFIVGYHLKTNGYIYAELSGPDSIPMTIPTSQP